MQRTNIHKEVSLTQTTKKLEEVMAIEVVRERATEASDRRSSIVFSLLSNSLLKVIRIICSTSTILMRMLSGRT
jgi:hypothetical protein